MSKSGHDPGKSGHVAAAAKVHWAEKGEEELDGGGKQHQQRELNTISCQDQRAVGYQLGPGAHSSTWEYIPLITCLINNMALCGEPSACTCQCIACVSSSRSDVHASYRLCWATFKLPCMELSFSIAQKPFSIFRSLQEQRKVDGGVPSIHSWVEVVSEPTSYYNRF